jgi:hypothetical protein
MNKPVTEDIGTIKNQLLNEIILWTSIITTPGVILSVSRSLVIGWLPLMGIHIIVFASVWFLWLGRRQLSYRTRTLGLLALLWIVPIAGFIQLGPFALGGIFVVSFSFIAVLFLGNRLACWLVAGNALSLIIIGIAASLHWLEFNLNYPVYAHHPITWANTVWTFSAYSFVFALFGGRLMD